MKFLNYDKVLCLSPHPDDVEYAMLGSILKYKDTKFDIVVLSEGGDMKAPAKETKEEKPKKESALQEDGSPSSTYIAPKTYYPGT